jgi:hypothetical protein
MKPTNKERNQHNTKCKNHLKKRAGKRQMMTQNVQERK